jgi:hypothetical protein
MLTASSHDTNSNVASSLMSDLKKQDAQEARDERRHLDVDVDYGKTQVRSDTARVLVD